MPKEKKAERPRARPSEVRGAILPIQCAGEECDAQSILAYPGEPPYSAGVFIQKGWLAMSTPQDEDVVYLCPKCSRELIIEAESELGIPPQPKRAKVSG
jgi:hypothetical protein